MLAEQRISRATLWMSGAAITRALIALAAQIVIAREFGAARETDAYAIGISLPQVIGDFLVGGTLFSAFIPVFVQTWKREGEGEAWRIANAIISLLLLFLAAASALYACFADPILRLLAPGFDDATLKTAVGLARVLSPLFLLFGLSFLAAGILQSYRHFTTTAIASLAFPILVLLSCLLLAGRLGIASLALGALAGAAAQCGIQWIVLVSKGGGVRLGRDWRHPGVRRVARIMAPIAVGVVAVNVNYIYQRYLASTAQEGMVAALSFATTFGSLPLLLLVPLSQAVFPLLSAHASEGRRESFRDLLTQSLRLVGFVGIPVVSLLVVLRTPIVRLVLERGAFDAQDTALVSQALLYLALGTLFFSCNQLMARSFYATGSSRVPMWLNVTAVSLTLPMNALLVGPMGIGGLALARASMFVIFFAGCLVLAHKRLVPLPWLDLGLSWGRVAALSLAMVLLARQMYIHLGRLEVFRGPWGEGGRIGASVLAGAALFLGGSLLLRVREVREIWRALRPTRAEDRGEAP